MAVDPSPPSQGAALSQSPHGSSFPSHRGYPSINTRDTRTLVLCRHLDMTSPKRISRADLSPRTQPKPVN